MLFGPQLKDLDTAGAILGVVTHMLEEQVKWD
jgi:hypothetical protein